MAITIKVKNTTVGYNDIPLIKDIDFELGTGEIISIIGPNGAGKSTILKSIIKELKLIDGKVFLLDKDMSQMSGNDMAKKMSVLMTGREQSEYMSCFDVVAMGRYPYTDRLGILRDKDREVVIDSLRTVNGEELAYKDFNQISDGQRQRILFARCIAQEPSVIILDEPTSFLDIKYKIELLNILEKLKATKNVSVIMSMHEIDFAMKISDRIITLSNTGIDRIGTPDEIGKPEYIRELFGITKEDYDRFYG